jgi:thiamine-phosphate diphosphorylase
MAAPSTPVFGMAVGTRGDDDAAAFLPDFRQRRLAAPRPALGVRLVQIRLKDRRPPICCCRNWRCAASCAARHGATLVVNDHWQAAMDLGCDFIHLGQEDLDSADLAAIRKAGLRLGISTHDHAELDRALALAPDYIALGPVWPTILKKMKWEQQGLERVTRMAPAGRRDAAGRHRRRDPRTRA